MSQQKRIGLYREEHEVADDVTYTLVIEPDGSKRVEVFYSPNKPYSKATTEYIFPKDFDSVKLDGKSISELIKEKSN